jgi:hypothetical protein
VQSGGDVNLTNQFRVGHWPQADVGAGVNSIYTLNGGTINMLNTSGAPFDEGQQGISISGSTAPACSSSTAARSTPPP